MKRLRKAVRDYLTMRRGLGFKMARHEVGLEILPHSWSENAAPTSP
jgi:hypothetical protein